VQELLRIARDGMSLAAWTKVAQCVDRAAEILRS
jgi:hypothetical protein